MPTTSPLSTRKIVFSKPKDELIYNYGILRCGAEDFHRLDPADILAWRKNDYQWDVLVEDKKGNVPLPEHRN